MRVGILTQYYPPEAGAPQARLSSLARSLSERGHEVVVLTTMPNYPTGRIHEGYGGVFRDDEFDGIRVLRSFVVPSRSASLGRRTFSYLSFVVSSLLVGTVKLPRLDYLLTESPPLFLALSGYVLSSLKRARWILNVSDLWPGSVEELGVTESRLALSLAEAFERFCYRHAWLVTGQSLDIVRSIEERVPTTEVLHFSNGVDVSRFTIDRPSERSGRFVYVGLHGLAQGLDTILRAIEALDPDAGARFEFFGDGPMKEDLVGQATRAGLMNVVFRDPVPHRDVPAILAGADVAIVPLKKQILGAVPSKLYEAMAAGAAVLLVAGGEAAQIVREGEAGVVVDPGDVVGITSAMLRLASDTERCRELGERGRRAAAERFDRRRVNEHLILELERRLDPSAAR